jgi:hypothetical protein
MVRRGLSRRLPGGPARGASPGRGAQGGRDPRSKRVPAGADISAAHEPAARSGHRLRWRSVQGQCPARTELSRDQASTDGGRGQPTRGRQNGKANGKTAPKGGTEPEGGHSFGRGLLFRLAVLPSLSSVRPVPTSPAAHAAPGRS